MLPTTRTLVKNDIQYNPLHKDAKRVADKDIYARTITSQIIDFSPVVFPTGKVLRWESVFREGASSNTGVRVIDIVEFNGKAVALAEDSTRMRVLNGTTSFTSASFGELLDWNFSLSNGTFTFHGTQSSKPILVARHAIVTYQSTLHLLAQKRLTPLQTWVAHFTGLTPSDTPKYSPGITPSGGVPPTTFLYGSDLFAASVVVIALSLKVGAQQDNGTGYTQVINRSHGNVGAANDLITDMIGVSAWNMVVWAHPSTTSTTKVFKETPNDTTTFASMLTLGATEQPLGLHYSSRFDKVFVATTNGIYSLAQSDTTGTQVFSGKTIVGIREDTEESYSHGQGLYAIEESGDMYFSSNGTSWSLLIAKPDNNSAAEGFGIADNRLYCGGRNTSANTHHLYRLIED